MCELGCSTGHVVFMLAQHFPNSKFYGYDLCADAIAIANKKAAGMGLGNVQFAVQDCCSMPAEWTDRWDFVFAYDLVHDVPQASTLLEEIRRVLKPGCYTCLVDVNLNTNVEENLNTSGAHMMYAISLFHCLACSLASPGSQGLGAAWGKQKALQMLKEAGFTSITPVEVEIDKRFIQYVCSY